MEKSRYKIIRKSKISNFCPWPVVMGILGGSVVKNLPAMQKTWVPSIDQWDPLEKGMTTHSSILAWEIPWTEEPGGPQAMGSHTGRHDWVTNTFTFNVCLLQYREYDSRCLRVVLLMIFPIFLSENVLFHTVIASDCIVWCCVISQWYKSEVGILQPMVQNQSVVCFVNKVLFGIAMHDCTHFTWTKDFQMYKLDLEKAEEPEINCQHLLDHS